jgi:hypothetical protein
MNPGPIEEAGRTARGIVGALKEQPSILALILFNLAFMAAIFFSVQQQREYNRQIIGQLIASADRAQEMLFKCIEPKTYPNRIHATEE